MTRRSRRRTRYVDLALPSVSCHRLAASLRPIWQRALLSQSSGEEFAAPKSSRKKSTGGRKFSGAGGTPAGSKRNARPSAASSSAAKRKRPAAGKKAAQDEIELDGSETEGEDRPKKARTATGPKGRRPKAVAEPAAIEKDNIFFSASARPRLC
jgi:hypothetical protein